MSATLWTSAAFAAAAAVIYTYVGRRILGGRAIDDKDARLARNLFATWWFALAAATAIGGAITAFAAVGWTDVSVHVTTTYVSFLMICLALWGLLYYLLYMFTGARRILVPLSVFYIAYYAFIAYLITASHAESVAIDRWGARLEYSVTLAPWIGQVILALLLLPQIGAALALLWLSLKVRDAAQRYRAILVGASILVWFAASYAASLAGVGASDAWQVGSRILGLAAALAIAAAYAPPRWVRQRLGIEPQPHAAGGQ